MSVLEGPILPQSLYPLPKPPSDIRQFLGSEQNVYPKLLWGSGIVMVVDLSLYSSQATPLISEISRSRIHLGLGLRI